MYGQRPMHYPWNVGEDTGPKPGDTMLAKPGFAGLMRAPTNIAELAAHFAAQQQPQQQVYAKPAFHPAQQQYPQGFGPPPYGVYMETNAAFNPALYYNNVPSKNRTEDLPLSAATGIAAGATALLQQTVQKPFQGQKIIMAGDLTSFVITSIIAAGQTVTAAAGDLPASIYANVDSLNNIGLPPLTAGASIVIAVRNISGAAGNLYASVRGFTGEG